MTCVRRAISIGVGIAIALGSVATLHAAVVGSGTAGSCTESALDTVLASNPATVSFNCGAAPITITLTTEKTISASSTIDGGNLVTLDANNAVRHIHVAGSGTSVTLRNLIIVNGNGSVGLNSTGGAVYSQAGTSLVVDTVTFSNNHSLNGGGAIGAYGSSFTATASTFANNSATSVGAGGGAIESNGGTVVTIVNSTFSGNGNGVSGSGAAIEVENAAAATITNSTFSANNGNGAVEADSGVTITLRDTIIAGTVNGPNCRVFSTGVIVDGGNNLQFGGNIAASCGAAVTDANPLLGALANNGGTTQTQALGAGSPAIDAGNDATCATTDQRGIARPLGLHCDIGAFEAPVATVAPTITNGPPPGGTTGGVYNFTYTASGTGPITYSVTAGVLPPGLTLSAAGSITGTPTQSGTFNGTVSASNGTLPDATQAFSIVIASPAPPTIEPAPTLGLWATMLLLFCVAAIGIRVSRVRVRASRRSNEGRPTRGASSAASSRFMKDGCSRRA